MKRRQHQKLQRGVDEKKLGVENAMKANEEHSVRCSRSETG